MRREVEFKTGDGVVLRGDLHAPQGGPSPGLVMAHGFSGVKEQIDHYAAAFAEQGFAVLVHDHRSFGASDGTPRLEVDAALQLADWRDAISFALTQPEFDPMAGVGAWGSSFAGGLAIVLGATDSRVRCVVSQIPNVSGPRNAREMFNETQRGQLREAFAADRAARFAGAEPRRVPVFSPDPKELAALPPAMSAHYIATAEARTPAWCNEVTLRSVENMLAFEPAGWIGFISPKPFMMIVGAQDTCTFSELQLRVFKEANEPKRLVIHPGGHFATYTEHFAVTSEAAASWFGEHLMKPYLAGRIMAKRRAFASISAASISSPAEAT